MKSIHIKDSKVGSLHRALKIALDKHIPTHRLEQAKKNASPALEKKIVFAENARKWKK